MSDDDLGREYGVDRNPVPMRLNSMVRHLARSITDPDGGDLVQSELDLMSAAMREIEGRMSRGWPEDEAVAWVEETFERAMERCDR